MQFLPLSENLFCGRGGREAIDVKVSESFRRENGGRVGAVS
jgi:hypothetical protein